MPDHAIKGQVSRETLIGLLVHHAEMPASLQSKEFAPVARHLAGLEKPPSAGRILDSGDYPITPAFASRIQRCRQAAYAEPGSACARYFADPPPACPVSTCSCRYGPIRLLTAAQNRPIKILTLKRFLSPA